ncbi:uncharacterized protein LOC144108133 [Amblyomma americanum]
MLLLHIYHEYTEGVPMKRNFCFVLIAAVAEVTVASASSGEHFDDSYVSQLEQLKRRLFRDRAYDPAYGPFNGSSGPLFVRIDTEFEDVKHIVRTWDYFYGD